MEKLLYWELGSNQLTEELSGGGASFSWPELTQSESVILDLRCSQRVGGSAAVETRRTVTHVRAAIGRLNGTADRGQWGIRIGDDPESAANTIAPVDHDVTASDLQAAINGLDVIGEGGDYGTAEVILDNGSWILTFAGATERVPIHVSHNSLFPACHVRRRAHEQDDVWYHEIRLVQVKAAFTSNFELRQVDAPVIAEFQRGSEVDGVPVNEIQKITFTPGFRGLYKVKRGLKPTVFLDQDDGPAELQEVLAPLADQDGAFLVTRPSSNLGHIEFTGSMGGQLQDLLEVFDVQAPPPDLRIVLDLDNAYCAALLRDADIVDDRIELPFELEIKYEDPEDDSRTHTWIYQTTVTVRRELIYEGEADLAEIDYLRPVDPTGHVPFNPSQVANGQQFYSFTIGDSVKVAWLIDHQRHTKNVDVKLRENVDGGKFLIEGTDYRVQFDPDGPGDDAVLITLLGAYAATPPAPGALFGEVVARREVSAFQAGVTWEMAQINGLLTTIAAMQAEIDELKAQAGTGTPFLQPISIGGPLSRPLGTVWRVPRARTLPARPESLLAWRATAETLGELPQRPLRLLPAVHAASTLPLPATLPKLAAAKGKVYVAATDRKDLSGVKAGDIVTSDGREFYKVKQAVGTTSYYPVAFETLLFETAINPLEFPARSTLELLFGLEMVVAMLEKKAAERRSACQWTVLLEAGVPSADAIPATPGGNLASSFTSTVTLLKQRLILTEIPTQHLFGVRIVRAGDGTMTARKIAYGRDEATTAPPSVPFGLRCLLTEFDTENAPSDARGVPAVRGLDVGLDGAVDSKLGRLTIS